MSTTRRAPAIPHAARWNAAIADCTDTLGRSKLAPSTLARIGKHLRRFAADVDAAPYDVTAGQVAAWLDSLTCGTSGRYAYRTSLRTFYGWAHNAGRIAADPTDEAGPHPLARPVPPGWAEAVRDFRRWLAAANYSRATADLYAARLAALARETGAPDPWQLTSEDLAGWMAGHMWARETVRGARTVLRTFYGWAHEAGHVDTNPATKLPKIRPSTPLPRPAQEDHYRAALALADDRTALMLRLAAELGLRRAEVSQVHALDLATGRDGLAWLTVHGKGDKPRRLPLPRELAAELRRHGRDNGNGYLFPGNDNGHLSPRRVGELVTAVLPEGVTMHALRHRFATRAYSVNRDLFAVQQLLGHARADTTQRYVQVGADAMRALVDHVAAY